MASKIVFHKGDRVRLSPLGKLQFGSRDYTLNREGTVAHEPIKSNYSGASVRWDGLTSTAFYYSKYLEKLT